MKRNDIENIEISNTQQEEDEDSEEEEKEKITIENPKKTSKNKNKKKQKKKTTNKKKLVNIKILKDEEKEFVEFVLGDFHDFHKVEDLKIFSKMTSLSLINESINDMSIIINNIPNKNAMIYLCMNENNIKEIKNIHLLPNLKSLHLNFNQIEKIDEGINKLENLKTFWICENQIKKIENIPEKLENFWIANNLIENIPNDFYKYKNLENLNISGNLLNDFQNIYNLEKLPNIKQLYLYDINFGENPICLFSNYRMMMIHRFKNIEILDQYKIDNEEKNEIETSYIKKTQFYKNKIRQTHKITKMIFQLMKGHKFFFKGMKYHHVRLFSQQQKNLEYKIYEKEELGLNSKLKVEELQKEINTSKEKMIYCLKEIELLDKYYKEIKEQISDLNDFSIVSNFYEIESLGNYKLEPGSSGIKWVKSCFDLLKLKIPKDFFSKNDISNINFNRIYRVHNKKSKLIYESIYDNLLDLNNQFGSEKKFFDFYFLILPKDILFSYRKLLRFLFEIQENEKEMILTDNFSFIDQFSINEDKNNNKFVVLICKCMNFDNLYHENKTEKEFKSINEIITEIKNINNDKDVTKLILEKENNTTIFHYKLKGSVEPEYIIEYEYVYKDNKEKSPFLSSYNQKVYIKDDHENIFNLCSRELCSECNKQFFSKEIVDKYFLSKFSEFNELDNNMIFFYKNTILNFLKQSFRYNSLKDFKDELNKINEQINEITFCDMKKTFKKSFLSTDENEKLNIDNVKNFNIFNNSFSNSDLDELFKQIKQFSEADSKVMSMTKRIEKVILSNNQLNSINLYTICNLFPNVKEIDISHNFINSITFEPLEINKSVINIDISFNDINDFSNVILIINQFTNLSIFKFFANPFNKFCELNFCNFPSNFDITKEQKENIINTYKNYLRLKETENLPITIDQRRAKVNTEILNFLYQYECYSFSDKYKDFCNNLYFSEKFHQDTSLNIINLTRKKFRIIPTIEGGKDTQVLFVNLNKIQKISNLEQFTELLELHIQNNQIKMIENLPKSLLKLDISNNELNNLENISKLNNLEWLNIENNSINTLIDVIKLYKLIEFYAAGNLINNVKECCQLGKLKKLEVIDIYGNEVCRINPDIRLTMIYYCQNLKSFNRVLVDLNEKIKSKDYFVGRLTSELLEKRLGFGYSTKNLLDLDLSSLKLKDEINLFSKESYPKLKKLNLSRNIFKSFSIFGTLPNLKELNLSYNLFVEAFPKKEKIISGKGLFGLPNLENLEMSNNQLVNLNGLQFFKKLKTLILKENNFTKIESLNNMEYLTYLDVSNNKMRNVDRTSLGDLPNLQIFICDNNLMKNINGFSKYESLTNLSFQNNKIQDLNCLEKLNELNKLKEIILKGNPLTRYNNYRLNLIKLMPKLIKIDGNEITEDEINNSKKIEQKPIGDPNLNYNIDPCTGQRFGGNYYYNFNTQREKAIKKAISISNNNNGSPKKLNLPIISNKPISSDNQKRVFNGFSNTQNEFKNSSNGNLNKNNSQNPNRSTITDVKGNKYKIIPDKKKK